MHLYSDVNSIKEKMLSHIY